MLYLEEYNELYKKVAEPIKITNKCAEVLYKDKSLKTFLKLVLTMGNYLNSVIILDFKLILNYFVKYNLE